MSRSELCEFEHIPKANARSAGHANIAPSSDFDSLRRAEQKLLERIPGCSCFDAPLAAELGRSSLVPAGELLSPLVAHAKEGHLHTIELKIEGAGKDQPVLVMLPGYGSGAGAFSMCLESFIAPEVATPFGRIYVLDWPGTGLSSPFDPCQLNSSGDVSLSELISYATTAIEAWRVAQGISQMTLLGHSLGGYLAFNYCERYGSSVTHLILSSPAGVATYPGRRDPPISEDDWLAQKESDLRTGRRNKTDFDSGQRGQTYLRCFAAALSCCAPVLLLVALVHYVARAVSGCCCGGRVKNKQEKVSGSTCVPNVLDS
jgi:pimeloyl-ACP methyl ester carboxylesterase